MAHWNVWENGERINRYPLTEKTAKHMVWLMQFNYGRTSVKAIKAWTR